MAKKTLRPYQVSAVQSLFDYLFNQQGNPLIVAPVGSGKSLMMAEFVRQVHERYPRTRIVCVTHVKELLMQNSQALKDQYPESDYGFYCASLGQKRLHNDITFASIQSVYKKVANFNRVPELIIVDECHLISHNDQTTYRKLIDSVLEINPNCRVIGFTGTPFRADTGRLDEGKGKIFDAIAYEISMAYMIEEGYWAKPTTAHVKTVMDVSGVGKRGGDYIAGQLEKAVDLDDVTKACVSEIIEHGQNRKKWLVFTAGVQHCTHVYEALTLCGVSCAMVTGDTPKDDRDRILADFKAGHIKCVVNVAVLTTGFDAPDIDMIAFMRPTKSPVLYIQMTGRGVRPVYADGFDLSTKEGRLAAIAASVKPDCLVLDFGNVINELGAIDTVEIRKTFNGEKEKGEGEAPTKRCPSCSEICMASQKYCYSCGFNFISKQLSSNASAAAVVSIDEPPEWYQVFSWNFSRHMKSDGSSDIPTMRVTYSTMAGTINEFIAYEHYKFGVGTPKYYAYERARKWHNMTGYRHEMPLTVEKAMEIPYKMPTKILLKREGKYWRVMDYDWQPVLEEAKQFQLEEGEEIPF